MPTPYTLGRNVSARQRIRGELDEQDSMADEGRARGTAARDTAAQDIAEFSPNKYASEVVFKSFLPGVKNEIGRARADIDSANNRRGLLHSGISEGRFNNQLVDRLGQALAGYGFQAAGLEQGRIGQQLDLAGMESEIGMGDRENYLEMAAGEADREQAEKNAKKKSGGLFGSILGTALGSFGGGLGAKVGERLGSKLPF
jgi:hypothetical protein